MSVKAGRRMIGTMKTIRSLAPPAAYAEKIMTLERHPIVIKGSRTRAGLLLACCLAFVLLGAIAIAKGEEDVLAAAFPAALIFGLGIAVAGVQIARPATLTLTAQGIAVRTIFRRWSVRYDQVQDFFVYRPRTAGASAGFAPDMTAFTWSDPPQSAWRWLSVFRAPGLDGSFGAGWQLPAQALTNLLNAARDHALQLETRRTSLSPAPREEIAQ